MNFAKECCYYSKRTEDIEPCKLEITIKISCDNKEDEKELNDFYSFTEIPIRFTGERNINADIKDLVDMYIKNALERFRYKGNRFGDGIIYYPKEEIFEYPFEPYIILSDKKLPHPLKDAPAKFFIKYQEQIRRFQHLINKNSMIPYLNKLPWCFENIHIDVAKQYDKINPEFFYLISDYENVNMKELLHPALIYITAQLYEYLVLKDILKKLDTNHPRYKKVYKELASRFLSCVPSLEKPLTGKEFSEQIKREKLFDLYSLYKEFIKN